MRNTTYQNSQSHSIVHSQNTAFISNMKLTLLSKNEFHHDQCMLYRLNNASQSSRWLLVEDFWLWLLLVSVVAWLVRCWLEPGRGQQTAVRGEWPVVARPHLPPGDHWGNYWAQGTLVTTDISISRDNGHQLTMIIIITDSLSALTPGSPGFMTFTSLETRWHEAFIQVPAPAIWAWAVITVFTRHCWF